MRHAWLCCIAAMVFSVALFAGDGKKVKSVHQVSKETEQTQKVPKAVKVTKVQKVAVHQNSAAKKRAKKALINARKDASATADRSTAKAKNATKKKPAKRR